MQRTDSLETTLSIGKIEGKRRRVAEDEMVEWYYRLNGLEFEQTPADIEEPGMLQSMG